MPEGKRSGSGWMKPSASRWPCQQSSMTRMRLPASRIPDATMASAVSRTMPSIVHSKWFQPFQPIGG
jgi:hypothetical protein